MMTTAYQAIPSRQEMIGIATKMYWPECHIVRKVYALSI